MFVEWVHQHSMILKSIRVAVTFVEQLPKGKSTYPHACGLSAASFGLVYRLEMSIMILPSTRQWSLEAEALPSCISSCTVTGMKRMVTFGLPALRLGPRACEPGRHLQGRRGYAEYWFHVTFVSGSSASEPRCFCQRAEKSAVSSWTDVVPEAPTLLVMYASTRKQGGCSSI